MTLCSNITTTEPITDELPGDDDYWLSWPWDTVAEQTDPEA